MLEHEAHLKIYSSWWYRELADNAPVMILASDLGKECIYFNKSWVDFSGRTLVSLINDGWTMDVHPDDIKTLLLKVERTQN
jgi:PAS domain S-box-containing protein